MATKPKARSIALAAGVLALAPLLRGEAQTGKDNTASLYAVQRDTMSESRLLNAVITRSDGPTPQIKPVFSIKDQSLTLPLDLGGNICVSFTVSNPSVFSLKPRTCEGIVKGAVRIEW